MWAAPHHHDDKDVIVPLDFGKIATPAIADSATEPRRIFAALPSKDDKYSYARDVQTTVWDRWHARRDERDLVIKMNTGGGKALVGLLALKSCLNESKGPVVYLTPNTYLAEQVIREAAALGLETADDPDSTRRRWFEYRAARPARLAPSSSVTSAGRYIAPTSAACTPRT